MCVPSFHSFWYTFYARYAFYELCYTVLRTVQKNEYMYTAEVNHFLQMTIHLLATKKIVSLPK